MKTEIFSRPARLGAALSGMSAEAVEHLFVTKKVLVQLEADFCDDQDARETFLFTVNQLLRFCPNIGVSIKKDAVDLLRVCRELAAQVHGPQATVEVVEGAKPIYGFDAVVNVGAEVLTTVRSVTVNSGGWTARVATGDSGTQVLHWKREGSNALGALAAACLGVGAAFLILLEIPATRLAEISLFTGETGLPGSLAMGPPLPASPLYLDAFLIGCGAVAHGWAYAVKRLPIAGSLQAVDRQSLRIENLGPYVAASHSSIGESKAGVIKELLSPNIDVKDRPDQWEFFKIRLVHELKVAPLIITGLDNVRTRHSVQRLWPETLIDMGAGQLQSQVIVKHKKGDGLCVLRALSIPPAEVEWAQGLAGVTGLDPKLIAKEPTGDITQAEIEAAPADKRAALQKSLGRPRCGYINRQSLEMEALDPNFAPAVPFVTALTGVVGAAETLKWLMGHRYPHTLYFQKSFESGRSKAFQIKCEPNCECQSLAA